ncbi:hypothetical protein PHAVU_003G081200 [Phaseolus vulgaris]|uniref:Uncharacterized protein n=1 Tax=Phaseolus vulgaris TaxID=3885 RepID=V7CAN5_PHAVU|nr:hypothetical protein PHAVU_003G081200g [Phaseolus vulgaris]ESW25976.1 hypothetical protein PHAVU_003G081200g [Phaseolus vulgaris]
MASKPSSSCSSTLSFFTGDSSVISSFIMLSSPQGCLQPVPNCQFHLCSKGGRINGLEVTLLLSDLLSFNWALAFPPTCLLKLVFWDCQPEAFPTPPSFQVTAGLHGFAALFLALFLHFLERFLFFLSTPLIILELK